MPGSPLGALDAYDNDSAWADAGQREGSSTALPVGRVSHTGTAGR